MSRELAQERIREAYERCRRHHDHNKEPFRPAVQVTDMQLEQAHHGTTDYSLAAWCACRESFRDMIRVVRGEPNYLVPDLDGNRTILEPALIIERTDGRQLALTGCAWGYGGEGPHGTAAILVDLGLFETIADAMQWVVGQDIKGSWELPVHLPSGMTQTQEL